MNPHLNQLFETLHDAGHNDVTRERVISALHLLGAHHSLEAIVGVCRRFFTLVDAHPALVRHPIPDLDQRLRVLESIGALKDAPIELRYTRRSRFSPLPLFGLTADGPICELLLLQSGRRSAEADFDAAVAWFVWQAIRHTHKKLSLSRYQAYIESRDGLPRLVERRAGRQLARAFRAIRRLGDPRNQQHLQEFVQLEPKMTAADALRMTRLCIRAASQSDSGAGPDGQSAREQSILPELRPMLVALWMPERESHRRSGFRRRASRLRRDTEKLVLRNYGACPSVSEPIVAGGGLPGVSLDIHAPPERVASDVCDDAPDIPPPLVNLFLADEKDFVRAGIAQKGLRAAVEYRAAGLPYRRSRLSRAALDALIDQLLCKDQTTDEEQLASRVLICLSLLTGRPLAQVAECRFSEYELAAFEHQHRSDEKPLDVPAITVFVEEGVIAVKAGAPELAESMNDELQPYLTAQTAYLLLHIPSRFHELMRACKRAGIRQLDKRPRYLTAARTLLSKQPQHFAIKAQGVYEALEIELLRLSRGDLGIVKCVTDSASLNLQNIIHYAAYDVSGVERVWHAAVHALVGDTSETRSLSTLESSRGHVGAPQRFRLEPIREAFAELRGRFQQHLETGAHEKAFNALTLYTLLWLNLATCSRGRLMPAPAAIVNDRWALVLDKHRKDGSTDRLIPMTDAALGQIRAYFDFVWALSVTVPRIRPLSDLSNSETLQFYWFQNDGQFTKFRPSDLEGKFEALIRLPGNWARKFVRQQAAGRVAGRYIDAALGHWVQGRAPWRTTSTMPSQAFSRVWTEFQEGLESDLGLTPLTHPDGAGAGPKWPVTSFHLARKKVVAEPTPEIADGDLATELRLCDQAIFECLDDQGNADHALAMDLANRYLSTQNAITKQAMETRADRLCQFMQRRWRVPIFRAKPTAVLRDDRVLESVSLFNLAHLERIFIPGFEADIKRLPTRAVSPEERLVEYGRMLAILIWKMGLHSNRRLDGFIRAYRARPVLKAGNAVYVAFRCRGERQNEFAHYTVFLTPWCRAFLVGERSTLLQAINANWSSRSTSRASAWARALNAYCEFLGMPRIGRAALRIMLGAANQRLMLQTSPLLAAYARGAFITNDLDDEELRRLAGLAPRTGCPVEVEPGFGDTEVSNGVELPDVPAAENRILALVTWEGADVSEMMWRCRNVEPANFAETLAQEFAMWLLAQHTEEGRTTLNPRDQRKLSERVRVVGYTLSARGEQLGPGMRIDWEWVDALDEASRELFPDVNVAAAWSRFTDWLAQPDCTAVTEMGCQVGSMAGRPNRRTNARIVLLRDIERLTRVLASPQSGIGNPATRAAAINAVRLEDGFGLRRSEAAMLRRIDVQGNVLRLQEYEGHGLKTRWASRLLVSEWLDDEFRAELLDSSAAGEFGERQVIARQGGYLDGQNLFPQINSALKFVTGSGSLGQHNLRHRMASATAFVSLANASARTSMSREFDWLGDEFWNTEKLDILLGGEPDAGQALQAISAIIGHSHPTTTLAHYSHTLALALHSHALSIEEPVLSNSFVNRWGSSNMSRWRQAAEAASRSLVGAEKNPTVQLAILTEIERRARAHIHIDERETATNPDRDAFSDGEANINVNLSFETLYRLEQNLWGEIDDIPLEMMAALALAFSKFAEMKTGKRGSAILRHPMARNDRGQPVPERLRSGSPTQCAAQFCEWLSRLHETDPELSHWLVNAYIARTDKRGRVRLDNVEEKRKARSVGEPGNIKCTIARAPVSKKRKKSGVTPKGPLRLQLHCLDDQGKRRKNDNEAIRWVMQLAFAQLNYVSG